jgi:chromosome segregation ATPase
MAELNELLEEAAGRAQDLSQDASEAIQGIRKLVDGARDLSETVDQQSQKAVAALRAVADKLDDAESRLESEVGETGNELDALATRAAAVREEVAGVLEQVKDALEKLSQRRQETQDTVDASLQTAAGDVGELGTQVQETSKGLSEHLDEAAEAVGQLRTAVTQAQADLQRKQGEWTRTLNEMALTARTETEFVGKGVTELLTRQTTALLDLGNHVIDEHNKAMDELKSAYAQEAKEKLAPPLQALTAKLEALGELSGNAKEALGTEADGLLGKVAAALPLIEQVKAVLGLTGRLG